ncbi:hypothetical protein AB0H12_31060 [Actinosynnema sp. NPDC023794]
MNGFGVDSSYLNSFSTRLHEAANGLDDTIAAAPQPPDTGKGETNKKLAHVFEALIVRVGDLAARTGDIADKVTESMVCYADTDEAQRRGFGPIGGNDR